MMKKTTELMAALALALSAGIAAAAVEVRFVEPEKYSDAGDFAGYRDREQTLKDIQAHFRELGDKLLPGKDLLIEVTDVDLAGSVEPVGRRMEMLRILRSTGRPAMELRYVLREGGKEIGSGTARLSDMSYLESSNRYSSSDPIRYEKKMMDAWFRSEFTVDGQTVSKNGR